MIWNDPMLRRGKKPEPEPVKPGTCGTVSNDARIQKGAEALFASGQGWFAPRNGVSGEVTSEDVIAFKISNMRTSSGAVLPSYVTLPWLNYDDVYGDISFNLEGSRSLYADEYGSEPYPFIVKIVGGAYLHNLAFEEFVGSECMRALYNNVILFDPDHMYGPDFYDGNNVMICDIPNGDGSFLSIPVEVTPIGNGVFDATMNGEILYYLSDINCGELEEGHVGYF